MQFLELIRRLHEAEVELVLVGGVAATLHGVAEPTRDLDVCIRLSAENWRRIHSVISVLEPRHALTPARLPIVDNAEQLTRYKNLYVLTSLGRVDFLGEVPPLGAIDSLKVVEMDIGGARVRVLQPDALIQVKEFVRRPKDLEVAAELRAIIARKKDD